MGLGARAFAGAEFFVTHGVSISSEFGWAAMLNTTGSGTVDMEFYDYGTERKEEDTLELPGDRVFAMDTDNFSGAITLNAYF